jgi:hypothetical protein
MKQPHHNRASRTACNARQPLTTELLVMPDGRILVHNLTPAFANLLHELNPNEEQIATRTHHALRITPHELPN